MVKRAREAALAAAALHAAAYEHVYRLDDVVRVWSDYLPCYMHPRTVVEVSAYEHASEAQPFLNYGQGRELAQSGEALETYIDGHLRFFTEECDRLQVRPAGPNRRRASRVRAAP